MKRIVLFIIFSLPLAVVFPQVTRNKVVVEVGTGTWCPYCPGAAMGVEDLISNGWPVAAIKHHYNDIFANQYSLGRIAYYGITGYPTAFFDGGLKYAGGSNNQSLYDIYLPRVQQRMNVPSPVTISVHGTSTNQTYDITVTVTKVSPISGSNVRLHLCLTESSIIYYWQGQNHLSYVNRRMVPDQNGTLLDFTNTDVIEIPLTFSIQTGWNVMHMELVAFVQTNSNKEIQNGFKVPLPLLMPPPPPLTASFAASDTATCEGNEIQYFDQSGGGPTAWYWEFPGGTPETSDEQNPVITYIEYGNYDVTLTVTKGLNTNTITIEDFMTIHSTPEVGFDPIEDQCINYTPFELNQGFPEGGNYSGPGVEDGFFHPIVAGIGTHTLIYSYMDENGCENFVDQNVYVDACTGVPENAGILIAALPNPTQGAFRLSITGQEKMVNLRIINSTGKIIYQQENIEMNGHLNTSINLSGQVNGIYYIFVEGKNNTNFKKIILQR